MHKKNQGVFVNVRVCGGEGEGSGYSTCPKHETPVFPPNVGDMLSIILAFHEASVTKSLPC